jgi:hypothetical protein
VKYALRGIFKNAKIEKSVRKRVIAEVGKEYLSENIKDNLANIGNK